MFRLLALTAMIWLTTVTGALGQAAYERPPINYLNAPVHDRVAQLQQSIADGDTHLQYDEAHGYLKSLLEALDIPLSSQTLVFSKTSLQLQRISPQRPRALYFNDDVYVGFCQNGDVLEIAATDGRQGATFYTLSQKAVENPKFERDRGTCLTCHATSRTQNVPGYLIRSVYADKFGRPDFANGTFNTTDRSDMSERWGGWYVSGHHGDMRHMGNVISEGDAESFDRSAGANDMDLSDNFPTDRYLSPHSDIVALMVLEHQAQMHNAIAAANYETRSALHQSFTMNDILDRPAGFISGSARGRISKAADRVVEHLLFCGEFQLTAEVRGTSSFAEEFTAKGPADSSGRSLREFDLKQRLFKYPCSYLIYSEAFASLPDQVQSLVFQRLSAVLEGQQTEGFEHLSPESRQSILEILRETLPAMQDAVVPQKSDAQSRAGI